MNLWYVWYIPVADRATLYFRIIKPDHHIPSLCQKRIYFSKTVMSFLNSDYSYNSMNSTLSLVMLTKSDCGHPLIFLGRYWGTIGCVYVRMCVFYLILSIHSGGNSITFFSAVLCLAFLMSASLTLFSHLLLASFLMGSDCSAQ